MEDIRKRIINGKITFKEAATKYSDDKSTKYNAGIILGEDGGYKQEKLNLSPSISYHIAGYNKGDITDVFEDEHNRKKAVIFIKIEDVIPAHQVDLATDFERVKNMALNKKKNEMLEKWAKEQLPDTFISIDKRYQKCSFYPKWNKTSTK